MEVLVEEGEVEGGKGAFVVEKKGGAGEKKVAGTDDDMLSNSDADSDAEEEEEVGEHDGAVRPLWRVVYVGDFVRVAVVSTEKASSGTWRVTVSLRPSLINVSVGLVGGGSVMGAGAGSALRGGELAWGAVRAVEDHGYVVTFGGSVPTLGFLSFADAPGPRLVPGAPVDVLVMEDARTGKKARKVVRVSLEEVAVKSAVGAAFPGMTVGALRAGIRVRAKVAKVLPGGGVELMVFGLFTAMVERAHVPYDAVFTVGMSAEARLLYVDAGSKRVGATLLPCLVNERKPRTIPVAWKVGYIVPSVVVVRVEPGYGVVLQEAGEDAGEESKGGGEAAASAAIPLFAHASRVSDERVEKLEAVFHRGLLVDGSARIVSFSPLDGVVNVDLRPSILARKALTVSEVVPGERYECKVVIHSAAGSLIVAVDGDMYIRGVVPAAHLSDTLVSVKRLAMHSRFKIGATLPCICLAVDADKAKVVLTSKRSLVNSERPILSSYEQALVSLKTAARGGAGRDYSANMAVFDGTVATVTERCGVLIIFPGGVRGMVPESELFPDLEDGKKPMKRTRAQIESLFPVGRTVSVRVVRVHVAEERMTLSFNLQRKHVARPPAGRGLTPGTFVSGKVASIDEQARVIFVKVYAPGDDKADGREDKKTEEDTTVECCLPFDHLSDFADLSRRIAVEYVRCTSSASSPVMIEDALVLTEATGSRAPVVTLKTSLVDASRAGVLPQTIEDVREVFSEDKAGMDVSEDEDQAGNEDDRPIGQRTVLRGYVKAALPSGIVVGFLGNLVGLARKSRICDDFVADPSKALAPHQSVCAVVESLDAESDRFTLSLRRSDIGVEAIAVDTTVFFRQFSTITDRFGCPSVETEFPVGTVVDSILDKSRPYGMVLNLKSTTGAKAFGVVLEQTGTRAATDSSSQTPAGPAGVAESESIASAAMATAEAHAHRLASTPTSMASKKRSIAGVASARKTRRQLAAEEQAATVETDARVLDVDPFTGVVDVSLDPAVVESAGKRMISSAAAKEVEATILLVKDEYVILSIARGKGKTVIAFALLPVVRQQLRLQLKQGLVVQARVVPGKDIERNLVTVDWVATSSALLSKKNASVAQGMSDRKKAKQDAKLAKVKQSGKREGKCAAIGASNVEIGSIVSGKVTASFAMQANVAIARGLVGRIHVTNCVTLPRSVVDALPLGPVEESLAQKCSLPGGKGKHVEDLRVLSFREKPDIEDHAQAKADKADDKPKNGLVSVELGLKDSLSEDSRNITEVGSRHIGFVKHVKRADSGSATGLWVELSPTLTGYCCGVDALPLETEDEQLTTVAPAYALGSAVACMVSFAPQEGDESRISVVASGNGSGRAFWGRVLFVRPGEGLRVELPWLARREGQKEKRWGLVSMCDVSDDYDEAVVFFKSVKVGTLVRVSTLPAPNLSEDADDDFVLLTMRPSILRMDETRDAAVVRDPVLPSILDKELVGREVRGFVRSVGKSGCFITIGTSLVARILLSNLADDFVAKPSEEFPAGMLVSGKFSYVDDKDGRKVQVSLRKRKRQVLKGDGEGEPLKKKAKKGAKKEVNVTEGCVLRAIVNRIERFGAIVSILDCDGVSALLHKAEADQDRKVTDPWEEWCVGQHLTVVGLKAGEDGKCRVGTKRCYFEAAGLDEDRVDDILETNSRKIAGDDADPLKEAVAVNTPKLPVENRIAENGTAEKTLDAGALESGDSDSAERSGSSEDDEDAMDDRGYGPQNEVPGAEVAADGLESSDSDSADEGRADPDSDSEESEGEALPIARGFTFDEGEAAWNDSEENNYDAGVSGPDVGGNEGPASDGRPKKSSRDKREKKRAKDAAEREIREREDALATRPDAPETAEDFERLLMGKPNASEIWIRYMAFRVSLSQFEKARALAERALDTIALPDELERTNVWIAYINLEATFGSSGEPLAASELSAPALKNRASAVFRVFDRACQRVTDVKDFHLQVASALRSSAPELADEVLNRALKAFKWSTAVWSAVGTAQFASGKVEAGRQILEKGLLSLEKQKHVALILKFAQLEYRYGSSERGRTVFSSLCANFPKRLDLWSVYLDMEIGRYRSAVKDDDEAEKEAALASVRLLFERCLSLDMSTKKTKFVFKRWLSFEVETGDKDAQTRVRSKARAYVETKLVPT
jgi:ribosomal protein S1